MARLSNAPARDIVCGSRLCPRPFRRLRAAGCCSDAPRLRRRSPCRLQSRLHRAGTVQQFGMAGPIRGCLFRKRDSSARSYGDMHEFANLAIEGEMAVRIGAEGTIAAVFPVIELHHFVFRGTRKTLPELVANNGLNGGFVLPQRRLAPVAGLYRAARRAERLDQRSSDRLRGAMANAGGVHASLGWLREHLAKKDRALLPEQIILTGTPLGLYPVRAGDRVVVRVDGKVGVECAVI